MLRLACVALTLAAFGCGAKPASGEGGPGGPSCGAGLEAFRGACVDPATRYEPATQADANNVVSFGPAPTHLGLPPPPRSGFRIVLPPRTLKPGEEQLLCAAWPFPAIHNTLVYAARLYATAGLHHSNVISLPPDPKKGPNPYPACFPGASNAFGQIGNAIPDALFANTTQLQGVETLVFPPGQAYRVTPSREILADVHLLNTTSAPLPVEVVYDFFTMPESELVNELGAFVADNRNFKLAPHSQGTFTAECRVFGGTISSVMPHTHNFVTHFQADAVDWDGKPSELYAKDGYDTGSAIRVYDPGFSIDGMHTLRFSCSYNNTKDEPLVYGNAGQEMCILFGYLYPAKSSFAAYQQDATGCQSVQVGLFK